MKFYCHHTTGCYIEADTAESAQEQLCELIRENIEPSHIEADPCEDGDTEGYDTANIALCVKTHSNDVAKAAGAERGDSEPTITDGYTTWAKRCPECGELAMQVVRPGKVQCAKCG